jgi:peptidoglycan/LPS O-acetylase OafA/YrhL
VKAKEEVYFGQLDGVRFIAVSLVLVDHWLAERNIIPFGPLGVTMFFVLSGFLITRILIQSKFKDETTGRSHWFSVKQFIIRRSLRIFPIYYLTIFACFALNEPPVREKIVWCLLYATNFYIAFKETWLGSIDHLWSLAVEEQYYLIFPYLILFLPKRYFLNTFWAMILISIGLRFILYLNGNPWMAQYVLMPTNLDSFGLGGLLAYLFTFHKENIFQKLNKNFYLIFSLVLYILVIVWSKYGFVPKYNFANLVLERLMASVFCFFLIQRAVSGFGGIMRAFLTNSVVVYLGKISYGLYLYHNFIYNYYHTQPTHITLRVLRKIYQFIPQLSGNVMFELLYFFGIAVVVASISWFLIEKPVNNLKKYFTY